MPSANRNSIQNYFSLNQPSHLLPSAILASQVCRFLSSGNFLEVSTSNSVYVISHYMNSLRATCTAHTTHLASVTLTYTLFFLTAIHTGKVIKIRICWGIICFVQRRKLNIGDRQTWLQKNNVYSYKLRSPTLYVLHAQFVSTPLLFLLHRRSSWLM